jgi:hypothetical protein
MAEPMMSELAEDQLTHLKQIRRWFYATLGISLACVVLVLVRPTSPWSLAEFAGVIALAMYLNSFKCPRCSNRFFVREIGMRLVAPTCAFCGLALWPTSNRLK